MIILECPNCHSKFNLDEDSFPGDSARLRCSVCSHIFEYRIEKTPLAEEESLIEEELIVEDEPSLDSEFASLIGGEEPEPAVPETIEDDVIEVEDGVQPDSVIKEIDSILGAGEEISTEEEMVPTRHKEKTGRLSRFWIMLLAVVLVMGIAGAWLFKDMIIREAPVDQGLVLERGPFFSIPDSGISYEILNNHKEGNVIVLKGIVRKLSKRPAKSVLVQARLYDETDKLINTRNSYAGVIPATSEFMRLDRNEMGALLGAEPESMGILANSREIPFVVAFFGKAARDAASYQIEVKEFHWQSEKLPQ